MSECANVSETLLSKFTLAVNYCPGQLATAGGQVSLTCWEPQSCGAETGTLRDGAVSLKSLVNWCSPSAILTDTLDRGAGCYQGLELNLNKESY